MLTYTVIAATAVRSPERSPNAAGPTEALGEVRPPERDSPKVGLGSLVVSQGDRKGTAEENTRVGEGGDTGGGGGVDGEEADDDRHIDTPPPAGKLELGVEEAEKRGEEEKEGEQEELGVRGAHEDVPPTEKHGRAREKLVPGNGGPVPGWDVQDLEPLGRYVTIAPLPPQGKARRGREGGRGGGR